MHGPVVRKLAKFDSIDLLKVKTGYMYVTMSKIPKVVQTSHMDGSMGSIRNSHLVTPRPREQGSRPVSPSRRRVRRRRRLDQKKRRLRPRVAELEGCVEGEGLMLMLRMVVVVIQIAV